MLCVDIGSFGIHMTVRPMHPAQELLCAAAGPAGSLALIFLSSWFPELARCAAVGSGKRIRYLLKRNLRITLLYGLLCGGILFLIAEPLCARLYPGVEVAAQLRRFCLLVPMLYCDLIVDGMTKGLGQQRYCVRYSIISNTLDVALLFVLLPRFGVDGYFASFLVTHLLNFLLSLRRLLLCGGIRIRFWYPAMAVAAALLSVLGASWFMGISWQIAAFCVLYFCLCYLFGVVRSADLQWLRGMIFPPSEPKTPGQSEEFSPSA